MCGIVGFTGREQAAPILLDGLSKLEYRKRKIASTCSKSSDVSDYSGALWFFRNYP